MAPQRAPPPLTQDLARLTQDLARCKLSAGIDRHLVSNLGENVTPARRTGRRADAWVRCLTVINALITGANQGASQLSGYRSTAHRGHLQRPHGWRYRLRGPFERQGGGWSAQADGVTDNQRNGARPRTISTTAGDLELRIPKLRTGSFFRHCWNGGAVSISACSRW